MTRRLLFAIALLASPGTATAEERTFALIIGVNQSVDRELSTLRYADDDAVRYQDLFELLGARTWLMSRLDENTARLHPDRKATPPVGSALDPLISEVAGALTKAREEGATPVLYVVYSGHGNQEDGRGYLTLEDARLDTPALVERIFSRLEAERTHFIVDACYSSFLALARGPGGRRREASGFSAASALDGGGRVGLLLSTSSARESHEWEAFQAGIFSHEVRSGLYGAADADGDGSVSYAEIGAFVDRANAAIPNEKYRPDLHARPPKGTEVFVDLGGAGRRLLTVDGQRSGHYFLEDHNGVRVFDFHNGPSQPLSLLRPAGVNYLHQVSGDLEVLVPDRAGPVALGSLTPSPPRSTTRGAAHEAFSRIFSLAYDRGVVLAYRSRPLALEQEQDRGWSRPLGISALSIGGLGIAAGVTCGILAQQTSRGLAADASQEDAAAANGRISALNAGLVISTVAGGVLVAAGALLLGLGEVGP